MFAKEREKNNMFLLCYFINKEKKDVEEIIDNLLNLKED